MSRSHALTYVSGRLISLVLLLGFQILLVRVLPAQEFGPYAFIFALATLMQTVMSFGAPRIISKYVTRAGWAIPNAQIRRLLLALLALRISGTALLVGLALVGAWLAGLTPAVDPMLLIFGALYIVAGVVQIDADSAAQALNLQHMSRRCMVGEAACRCLAVAALALAGHMRTAGEVLMVGFATATIFSIPLLASVLRRLAARDGAQATQRLDRAEVVSTGLNGYASTLAWFASSPAIIRLFAGAVLPVTRFAGFAFVQGLVISFQRYTPGALLFPFVEPVVMRGYARNGDKRQLEAGLSIVSKVDAMLIGAAIVGAAIAARPVVEFITGGKYGDVAYAIPWLLLYILTMPVYRSFEIAALLLDINAALRQTLIISVAWTAIAAIASTRFGMIALLVGPVGDAATRLFFLNRALAAHGVRRAADVPVLLTMMLAMILLWLGGSALCDRIDAGPLLRFLIGLGCSALYIAALIPLRPFRPAETALITGTKDGLLPALMTRITRPA